MLHFVYHQHQEHAAQTFYAHAAQTFYAHAYTKVLITNDNFYQQQLHTCTMNCTLS